MSRIQWKLVTVFAVFLLFHSFIVVSADEPAAEGDDVEVSRLVKIDDNWMEAEVFIVEPGKTIEMRVDSPAAAAPAVVSHLVPDPEKTQTYGLSTSNEYRWTVPFGKAIQLDGERLEWTAPAGPGHYKIDCRLNIRRSLSYKEGDASEKHRELKPLIANTTFHILVPHEFDPEGPGIIEGYPIGVYPRETGPNVKAVVASHRDRYKPPKWFVAVTSETAELRVSEHFRLREFVPDAPKGETVYFPYNPQLTEALEAIRAELVTSGVRTPRIRILRGYVSPHEAERLRRQGISMLTWNRYQYGDAVLVIVDKEFDDKMDDLNGSGSVDDADVRIVATVIRRVQDRLKMPGWIGVYSKRPDNTLPETPMVGFDLRGWRVETYGD